MGLDLIYIVYELNYEYNIIIDTHYHSPNFQINLFTNKLTDLLQFLSKANKYIFIIGDFNANTTRSSAIINPNIYSKYVLISLY